MKGLNKLYFLKIEIDEIKEEIKNLETLKSPVISDMPHSTTISNPTEQYFIKKQKLVEKLNRKLERYIDELTRIENIIDGIEDAEIRLIARYRFIDNLKWEQIGRKVHLDRSVCYKKLKKYFK
jgi:hypothetical protein